MSSSSIKNVGQTSGGHPYHGAFVHFPIAFLMAAQAFDIVYGLTTHTATSSFAKSVYDVTPFLSDIARLSHFLNILGLIAAVPATVTGGLEFYKLLQRQDVPEKLKYGDSAEVAKKSHPKLKVAFTHAILNDIIVAAAAYNWWTKSQTKASAPEELNILISALALPALAFSGYLGGKMVYEYGVGVNLKGAWGSKKNQ